MFTVVMTVIAIPPAIRAYSTAVAPDSLAKKRRTSLLNEKVSPTSGDNHI